LNDNKLKIQIWKMLKTNTEMKNELLEQDENTPSLLKSFKGHKDKITQVIFNPNLK